MLKTSDWIVCPKPAAGAALRLFCLPYAGGAASAFRSWSWALPGPVEVCALQLPGRGSRQGEPLFTDMPALADAVAEALQPFLDRPFALFGHSMGALLGFEVARRMRRSGGPEPVHLFASGCRAPHIRDSAPPVYGLSDAAFIDELRRLNGTPPALLENAELMEMALPVLRADFQVCDTYRYTPQPPLEVPVSAFGGLKDPDVPKEWVEAWREQTTGPFVQRMFQGDHFYLHQSEPLLLKVLARELMPYLRV